LIANIALGGLLRPAAPHCDSCTLQLRDLPMHRVADMHGRLGTSKSAVPKRRMDQRLIRQASGFAPPPQKSDLDQNGRKNDRCSANKFDKCEKTHSLETHKFSTLS
jgi:hypothetical protein